MFGGLLDLAACDELRLPLQLIEVNRLVIDRVLGGQLSAVHDRHELLQLLLVASDERQPCLC